jgi:hypothetical protein
MFDALKSLIHAGPAAKPVVVAPTPKPTPQVAEPAPVAVVTSLPASEPVSAPVSAEPTVEPVVVVPKLSKEPVVVDYTPEPAAPAPKRTPLVDPVGKLRAYQLEDGTLIAVTRENIEDPLATLSENDKRPVDAEEEARIDLAPRSSGRIVFLWETYENPTVDPSGVRLQKRLANDIARGLASRTRVEFDPERSANAAKINKFKAV